jgi:Mce-associated membrane protein
VPRRSSSPAWGEPSGGGDPEELTITSPTDTVTESGATATRRRLRMPSEKARITILAAATVLAFAAAIAAGVYWWLGTHGATATQAADRDGAIDAAEQIVVNINTVHPQSVDQDLAAAQSSLTDPMLTEYGKVRQQFADSLKKAQASVVADPAGASLTAFDDDKGTASALVAINVTASSANQQPTQKQQLFQVDMQRTPDGWKAAKASPTAGQS